MSRHFTIRKMLRMTPNRLLASSLERLGHKLLCFDWQRMPERCDEALLVAIGLLPHEAQEEMEGILAAVHELACDAGVQAIVEAALSEVAWTDFVSQLPEAGPYHTSMWTWLHFPSLFDQATLIHSVDNLTRWRNARMCRESNHAELQRPIANWRGRSQRFCAEEGRGQNCTVEHYRRHTGTDYYVAYPDDFVQTVATHDDDGVLRPESIRQTFEIVFAFTQEEGTLELYANCCLRMKAKLECLFGQIILRRRIGPKQIVGRTT